jgi:hypothetical protein
MTGCKRHGRRGLAVAGAAASLAPFRAAALRARRLPRAAALVSAAAGPRRNVPGAAPREQARAVTLAPRAPIAA